MAGTTREADDDNNDLYETPPDESLVTVSPRGDLIVSIYDHGKRKSWKYRVEADRLRQGSPYFASLLHPDKFAEGARVCRELASLNERYPNVTKAPFTALPQVVVTDVGRISKVTTLKVLAADFFSVLHGTDLSAPNPPVPNLANLTIVADRFDALPILSRYVKKHRFLQALDAKTRGGTSSTLSEERIRQKLLIGMLLDHGTWVSMYSKRLILKNSVCWKPDAPETSDGALYWDLPRGIEDELMRRRDYVLDTIQSLQTHFLRLYTHGERQCKLGYDSSPQCDSFQLGEMIRFFHRLDLFPLTGSIMNADGPVQYQSDIDRLIDTLRQCPEYQIDQNHKHCGLRERLLPLLSMIQNHLSLDVNDLDIGICLDCWQARRQEYSWAEAKRPPIWSRPMTWRSSGVRARGASLCLTRHLSVRDMFTAVTRDWTARDV